MSNGIEVNIKDGAIKFGSEKVKELFDCFVEKNYFSENNNTYTTNIDIFTEEKKVKNGCYYQLHIGDDGGKITSKLIRGFDANPTNNRKVDKSPALITPCPNGKNVVIILESPHRDEYDFNEDGKNSTITPIAPANGVTGRNIRSYIFDIISKELGCQSAIYNIYLLNRVSYQCSLGSLYQEELKDKTKDIKDKIRNEIFKELWSKNQHEFFKELKNFSPDIIIESCTQAVDDKTSYYLYTEKIEKILRQRYPNINDVDKNIFYYLHPSSRSGWIKSAEKLEMIKETQVLKEIFTTDLAKIEKLTGDDKIKYKDIIKEKNTGTIKGVLPYWKSIKVYNSKDLLAKLIAIGIVTLKDNEKLECIKKELES